MLVHVDATGRRRLEMRKGNWHPEQEDSECIPVYAFTETGKAPQVPGATAA